MDEFCARCNCKNRRFTGGKSKFLQAADRVKFAADAAAELCGIAYTCFDAKRGGNDPRRALYCGYYKRLYSSHFSLPEPSRTAVLNPAARMYSSASSKA